MSLDNYAQSGRIGKAPKLYQRGAASLFGQANIFYDATDDSFNAPATRDVTITSVTNVNNAGTDDISVIDNTVRTDAQSTTFYSGNTNTADIRVNSPSMNFSSGWTGFFRIYNLGPTNATSYFGQVLNSVGHGVRLNADVSNRIRVIVSTPGNSVGTSYALAVGFHTIAYTFDPATTEYYLYQNGSELTNEILSGTFDATTINTLVALQGNGLDRYTEKALFFNRILSPSEISTLHTEITT